MSTTTTTPDQSAKGWRLSSTVRACEAEGRAAGQEYGRAESRAETLARLLRLQARQRFGQDDATGRALLDALAQGFAGAALEDLGERLLTADSWASWLAGVAAPPQAPGFPDYARNLEIDLEPDQPSIDTLMKVGLVAGGEAVILLRLQKWYQPDLDRILFEESLRLERKYKLRPIIAVILMWPATDSPEITGTYHGRDRDGRPTTFTYSLRRAWEMLPEDALKSQGTMMLATLCKGARERMPEIVRQLAQGMKTFRSDAKTCAAIWITSYWSMGMVCSLEEAHAALGDRLPYIQNTADYKTAKGQAFREGYHQASTAGALAAARGLLLRQGSRRFGPPPNAEALWADVEQLDRFEALATRVLTAADWATLLGEFGE